jgi:hypothetical protein
MHHLDLNDANFQKPRTRVSPNNRTTWQVHRFLMSFDYVYQITCKILFVSLVHYKVNNYFPIMYMIMWWAMEPWYEFGGGSIATRLYTHRT